MISFKNKNLTKETKAKSKVWRWIKVVLAAIFGILFLLYLSLGELRFFVHHAFSVAAFDKHYLILLQNNYELRPTGGFITGYGEATVNLGGIKTLEFHNSYEIDTPEYVTPPYPHEALLQNEWYQGYTFRDANWNPDFPQAAEELLNFYQDKFPDKPVDGIVVVNFTVLENLVGTLGEIEVNGEKLNKENLFKRITDSVNDIDRHSEEDLAERKSILSELIPPLMGKMKWHPFKTRRVIVEALHQKDLFMWFSKDRLQRQIEVKGWANTWTYEPGTDFLAVNLANMGSKKADRYLMNAVDHWVVFEEEAVQVTTTMEVTYPGEKNIYADDYVGYLRFYLPSEATVIGDRSFVDQEEEMGGFKVIGSVVSLAAGETQSIPLTYELPRGIFDNGDYQVKVIQQSGHDLHYRLTAEAPLDTQLVGEGFVATENKAHWEGKVENEMELSLSILPDSSPPYPLEQVFEDLNTISIYWAEPIDEETGGDPQNYEVVDMDRVHPEVTDAVRVVGAEVLGSDISKLYLQGATPQSEERYQIRMTGVQDQAGNTVSPEPKVITAIQR